MKKIGLLSLALVGLLLAVGLILQIRACGSQSASRSPTALTPSANHLVSQKGITPPAQCSDPSGAKPCDNTTCKTTTTVIEGGSFVLSCVLCPQAAVGGGIVWATCQCVKEAASQIDRGLKGKDDCKGQCDFGDPSDTSKCTDAISGKTCTNCLSYMISPGCWGGGCAWCRGCADSVADNRRAKPPTCPCNQDF